MKEIFKVDNKKHSFLSASRNKKFEKKVVDLTRKWDSLAIIFFVAKIARYNSFIAESNGTTPKEHWKMFSVEKEDKANVATYFR